MYRGFVALNRVITQANGKSERSHRMQIRWLFPPRYWAIFGTTRMLSSPKLALTASGPLKWKDTP